MISRATQGAIPLSIFLSGAAFAAIVPFSPVLGMDILGLDKSTYAALMVVNGVVGTIVSVLLGNVSDRIRDRRVLVVACALMGSLGFALIWAIQSPLIFMVVFGALMPFGNALFSQSFAYARALYDRHDAERSQIIMSYLRSGFTLAWIVAPPFAGWLAATYSTFEVFLFAATAHFLVTLSIGATFRDPKARIGAARQTGDRGGWASLREVPAMRWVGVGGLALCGIAMQMQMVSTPMFVVRDLGGSVAQIGFISALAALIEVPAMIAWGYVAVRIRKEHVLAIAGTVFATYLFLLSQAQSIWMVYGLQVLAAIAIAALLSINISYLQETVPGRLGLSTSLLDVNRLVTTTVAAVIFGALPTTDFAPLLTAAAVISLCGAAALVVAGRSNR